MTGPNRGALRRRSGVLAERDYRLFFTGYTTSLAGAAMVPVALTFAVLQEGRTAADAGYVLAAQTIPLVALLLAGGVAGDRLSRRMKRPSRCGAGVAGSRTRARHSALTA